MVEKSMLETDEIEGEYSSPSVHPGEQHRGPMQTEDDDKDEMPGLADGAGSTMRKRDRQVDDTAVEYTPSRQGGAPRTLADEAAHGGFSQEWDQSYPEEGPRIMTGTRGAHDIGEIPGYNQPEEADDVFTNE